MEIKVNDTINGRYILLEKIGNGGMANVYRAHDTIDDKEVAIKFLRNNYLSDEDMRNRFVNEAKAIADVTHPNIVKIYDYCCDENLSYIVMEYVKGVSLRDYIDNVDSIPWQDAVHFTVQILRAVQCAHDNGIIHRDIKPENILIMKNASIKIFDFGIAKMTHGRGIDVEDGRNFGSVRYMSPEQLNNEDVTWKSDIYSIGVLLYELVTGRQPFDSESDDEVVYMQLNNDPVRPTAVNRNIPLGIEQIILHAMQKNPTFRFSSAAEFLKDINEFKRNPAIRFDYASDPGHAVAGIANKAEKAEAIPAGGTKNISDLYESKDTAAEPDEEAEDEDDDGSEDGKNMLVPIIIAGAVSVVLIVAIILAVIFGGALRSTVKDSGHASFFSRLFSNDVVEVPNFLNMKYEEALEKYPGLAFDKEPATEFNSTYEDGRICAQEPEAGTKIKSDTVIKLTVAASSEMVLVRDPDGMTSEEAKTMYENDGLIVVLVPEKSDDKKDGEVVEIKPYSVNSFVKRGVTLYVYYASKEATDELVKVPDLKGYDKSAAMAKISAAGLAVGKISETASTDKMKGLVISQSPDASASVKGGTKISIIIGAGGKEEETVTTENTAAFTVVLPSSGATGTITTFLNGAACDTAAGVKFDGSKFRVSFTGKGEDNSFKIFADGTLIYSGKIDFSKETPTVDDVQAYQFSAKANVPAVVGKTQAVAVKALNDAGFVRVNPVPQPSNSVPAGVVISQTPDSGTKQATTASVTIIVSTGPEETTVPPVSEEPTSAEPVSDETTSEEPVSDIPAEN